MNKFIDTLRNFIRSKISILAKSLDNLSGGKISPNAITIIGLLAHFLIAYLIVNNHFIISAVLLVVFGLFDALDGALARVQNKTSKKGMLLDSITDRLKEIVIYTSLAISLTNQGNSLAIIWVVMACGASLLISYINAWGEVVNKDKKHQVNKSFRLGFMSYDIRVLTIVIGLLTGYTLQAIMFIVIFGFWTAGVRFISIMNNL